jgi:hypothetical protein
MRCVWHAFFMCFGFPLAALLPECPAPTHPLPLKRTPTTHFVTPSTPPPQIEYNGAFDWRILPDAATTAGPGTGGGAVEGAAYPLDGGAEGEEEHDSQLGGNAGAGEGGEGGEPGGAGAGGKMPGGDMGDAGGEEDFGGAEPRGHSRAMGAGGALPAAAGSPRYASSAGQPRPVGSSVPAQPPRSGF